jgi:NADH:ubiquinone oxidoreductase subunit F (NADH-binding)
VPHIDGDEITPVREVNDVAICGLGQAAPNPLACVFRYFPD